MADLSLPAISCIWVRSYLNDDLNRWESWIALLPFCALKTLFTVIAYLRNGGLHFVVPEAKLGRLGSSVGSWCSPMVYACSEEKCLLFHGTALTVVTLKPNQQILQHNAKRDQDLWRSAQLDLLKPLITFVVLCSHEDLPGIWVNLGHALLALLS